MLPWNDNNFCSKTRLQDIKITKEIIVPLITLYTKPVSPRRYYCCKTESWLVGCIEV